jgi:hypothetical protein
MVMQLLKAPMVIWLKQKDIIIEEVSWLGRFCVILHAIALKGYFGILQKQNLLGPFWRLVSVLTGFGRFTASFKGYGVGVLFLWYCAPCFDFFRV